MEITEQDITGAIAKGIREKLGMTQKQFWMPLRVAQSVGARYESGLNGVEIPNAVRTLLIATHVAGMDLDATSKEGVAELMRMGAAQGKIRAAKSMAKKIIKDLGEAETGINKVRTALQSI